MFSAWSIPRLGLRIANRVSRTSSVACKERGVIGKFPRSGNHASFTAPASCASPIHSYGGGRDRTAEPHPAGDFQPSARGFLLSKVTG
jgi:hypothetical protein